ETHRKLAQLESVGKLQGIITTNIDCLHSIAGSENVAEIQGSFAKNTFLSFSFMPLPPFKSRLYIRCNAHIL
ncbi:MAG: hypothetical protein IJK63_09170, partial [Oscillospiraceae bacterium]|nr:hypothetical protein [Oscillospiraceae bacterium]